jgi:hypothetical protein
LFNVLQVAATMLVDQINTAIAVIPLCRPQMAILDFKKRSIYGIPCEKARPWFIYPRRARRNEATATENHDAKRSERNQACRPIGLISAKQRYARANADIAIKRGSDVESHQVADSCHEGQ